MIITFLGHRSLYAHDDLASKLEELIKRNISDDNFTVFYCGGYGGFDDLCAKICRSIKKNRANCELVFVTPYITKSQQEKIKELIDSRLYDSTVYPPLENVPPKFAINKRNEWMVEQADLIIAYINHPYGGAYKSLTFAKRKKKRIINLGEYNINS